MTLKTLTAAIVAASLTAPAAMADMFIIQQSPGAAFSTHVPMPSTNGSGFGMASQFIADMAATRMPGFDLDGVVSLDDLHPAVIEPATVYDDISFAGEWQLVEAPGVVTEDLVESDAPLVTFSIDASGQFNAYAGCNQIFGSLHQQDGALVEPMVSMTLMGCFGTVSDHERALTLALQNAALFAYAGDMLVFLNAEGDKLAEFQAL